MKIRNTPALAAALCVAVMAACSDGAVNPVSDGGATDASVKPDAHETGCTKKLDCGAGEDCVGGKCVKTEEDAGIDAGADAGQDAGDGGTKACSADSQCDVGWKCSAITKTCARPAGKLEKDEMDFGNAVFGTPETVSNTVKNIGTVDLVVLDFAFDSSTDKAAFSLEGALLAGKPYKLHPGEQLEIKVTFSVIDASAKVGKLQVTTDGDPSLLEAVLKTSFKGSPDFAIVDDTQAPPKVLWPDPANPGGTYSLDFKQVGVGQQKTISFVAMNVTQGSAPLAINGLNVATNSSYYSAKLIDAADKVTEKTPPVFLNPGDKVIVAVTFAPPTKNASVPGTLEIMTNDTDIDNNGSGDQGRAVIALAGVAGFPPGVSVSTNKIDFGEMQIGDTPMVKPVTITNTGDPQSGFPLNVQGSLALGSETSFTFDPPTLVIQPGDSKDVKVTFNPATNGSKTNELHLANDDPDADPAKHPVVIVLNGKGVNPNLAVDPPVTTLDFGDVGVGQTAQQVVTLINTGDGSLDLLSASINSGNPSPFTMTPEKALPVTLTPTGTADNKVKLTVTFTPTTTANYDHSLVVASTDIDHKSLTVELKGAGVMPQAQFNPTDTVDFGKVPMGSTSAEKTVTINNVGQGALVVTEISITQTASRFSITSAPNPLPYSIAAGSNVTVKLVYKPNAAVVEDPNANYLVIKSNDPTTPEKHIGFNGEGLNTSDPTAVILTTGTDLNGTAHNNEDLDTIGVDLTKTHTVTLDGKTGSHPNGGAPISAYNWAIAVKPGGSTASIQPTGDPWRVQFTPDKPGNYQITLVVVDDNAKSSPADALNVNGYGNDALSVEMSFDGGRTAWNNNGACDWLNCALLFPIGQKDIRFAMVSLTGSGGTCDGGTPAPNWGSEGNPKWTAYCSPGGAWAEPQVIDYTDGERSDVQKSYGVSVSYMDDKSECCDPGGSGGCLCTYCQHVSTVAHVTIKVNGNVVGGGTLDKTLAQQGAVASFANITRQWGVFTVTPVP